MPFLQPDIVKLDRGVLAGRPSADVARVVRGAKAHASRHGSLLLAEGIEDGAHEQRAVGFGAVLGQGWRYGRPAPLPERPDGAAMALPLIRPRPAIDDLTPFQALRASGIPVGVGTKAELLPLSIDLEREAAETRDPAVILATFQDADRFGARVAERYARLATGAAFVGAFGVGMAPEPAAGVRGASLQDAEALRDEWCVLVVGPHATMALIARDLGDTGPDERRRFEYALSEERELVMRAARSLMLRVVAEPVSRPAIVARV